MRQLRSYIITVNLSQNSDQDKWLNLSTEIMQMSELGGPVILWETCWYIRSSKMAFEIARALQPHLTIPDDAYFIAEVNQSNPNVAVCAPIDIETRRIFGAVHHCSEYPTESSSSQG
jgi:hypothetical protein